jgi:hypothetical protein
MAQGFQCKLPFRPSYGKGRDYCFHALAVVLALNCLIYTMAIHMKF